MCTEWTMGVWILYQGIQCTSSVHPVYIQCFEHQEYTNENIGLYSLQRDATMARLLFSSLFRGIFSEIEKIKTEREAAAMVTDINRHVNTMLSTSTQFYPPFISCVQVISGLFKGLQSYFAKYFWYLIKSCPTLRLVKMINNPMVEV